jgi:hypothetical protein
MEQTCIFCNKALDNSDEHIIPQSINGRLHSKQLICKKCNQIFGERLDPIIKETLRTVLHTLGIGNNSKIEVENEKGKKFLYDSRTSKIEQIVPEFTEEIRPDGKMAISVHGPDSKKTVKALAKHALRKLGMNALKATYSATKTTEINESYSVKFDLKIAPQFALALQKIIVEFYCHSGLEKADIQHLIKPVAELQVENSSIVICNLKHEVRKPNNTEISHLLVIRSHAERKLIYGYVELFNVVCGYIVLVENYEGPELDFVFQQDAITGEAVNTPIELLTANINSESEDFHYTVNELFERLRVRDMDKVLHAALDNIRKSLDERLASGAITKEEHEKQFFEEATKAAALISVENFEVFEDFTEQELRMIHYGNSIIRQDRKDAFAFFYHQLVNHQFTFEDEDGLFTMTEFAYTKHLPRGDVQLFKVFCKFVSEKDGSNRIFPASNIFKVMGIPYLPDDFTWNW